MIKTPEKIRNPKTKDFAVSIVGNGFSFHSIISCKNDVNKLLKTIKENVLNKYWEVNNMKERAIYEKGIAKNGFVCVSDCCKVYICYTNPNDTEEGLICCSRCKKPCKRFFKIVRGQVRT